MATSSGILSTESKGALLAEAPISTRPASSPFDGARGDLIIRTSDGVDFHVLKQVLDHASPFFANMFTLPRLSKPDTANDVIDVIDVAEPSAIWDHVLRICYNAALPPHRDDELWQLFEVAKKYDMSGVRWTLSQLLMGIPHTTPKNRLRVYTLACAFGFPDVAVAAAKARLGHEVGAETYIADLRCATSAAWFRWTEYRQKCVDAATSFAKNERLFIDADWMAKINPWGLQSRNLSRCCSLSHYGFPVRSVISDYMRRSEQVLQSQPSPSTVRDANLVAALVQDSLSCAICAPQVQHDQIAKFIDFYAEKIEKAIAEVKLIVES